MAETEKQFWYFLLNGSKDESIGAYGNFYAYGKHCGDALENARIAFREYGLKPMNLYQTYRLDDEKNWQLPDDVVQLSESVYMRSNLHYFEFDENEVEFIFPDGIVASTIEGDYDFDLIEDGFISFDKNDDERYEIIVIVSNDKLLNTFISSINFLPQVDGFWLYLNDYWEDSETQIWVSRNTAEKDHAINFLLANQPSTLKNGYIDYVVHTLQGKTNLYLDAHKTIKLYTDDFKMQNAYCDFLISLGFTSKTPCFSIEHDFWHYHYRPFDSLCRTQFIELLEQSNFYLAE